MKITDGKNSYNREKQGTSPMNNSWDDPDFEMLLSPVDSALFGMISDFMKGVYDIEDVKSDTAYTATNDEVNVMISDYQKNSVRNKDNEKFIRDSLAEETPEEKLKSEIGQIKHEIIQSNINDISLEWVKEWHNRKQRKGSKDPEADEIQNFITGSLEKEEKRVLLRSDDWKKRGLSKSLITRFISLTAAALIAAVFLIRSLLPSNDPQRIFSKYYKPFEAASLITRSTGNSESETFTRAVASYKSGDYQAAASGFSDAMHYSTESLSAGFFLGVTEIELGNYNKAIDLLRGVVNQKSTYTKEATWYLGFAYIKSGNKIKASECFELLARSPGFYSNRSEKILRLLR